MERLRVLREETPYFYRFTGRDAPSSLCGRPVLLGPRGERMLRVERMRISTGVRPVGEWEERVRVLIASLVAGALTLVGLSVEAQTGTGGWRFTIAPYLVAAGMDGAMTVKGLDADVDVPFESVVENLDMAAMVHVNMMNDHWFLSSDLVYMDLEGSSDTAGGTATASVTETLFEVTGGYRISPAVTLLAGARLVDLGTGIRYEGPNLERDAKANNSWVDPLVGVRVTAPLAESWWLGLHADVGGFGVGSDLAWQAFADVGFRASDLVSVVLGYRAIDIDYEEGEGNDLFRYDVMSSGPQLGVAFRF